jgi:hypothetical protein
MRSLRLDRAPDGRRSAQLPKDAEAAGSSLAAAMGTAHPRSRAPREQAPGHACAPSRRSVFQARNGRPGHGAADPPVPARRKPGSRGYWNAAAIQWALRSSSETRPHRGRYPPGKLHDRWSDGSRQAPTTTPRSRVSDFPQRSLYRLPASMGLPPSLFGVGWTPKGSRASSSGAFLLVY